MNKKTAIAAAVILVILIAGGSYFGIVVPETDKAARIKAWEETLVIGSAPSVLQNPDPYIGYHDEDTHLRNGHLVAWDVTDPAKFHPVIAESWSLKHKPDGTPYVEFKIKKGLKFNDGTEIDAYACKQSLDKHWKLEPRVQWARDAFSYTSLEAQDKYTLNAICVNDFGYVGTLGVMSLHYALIESPASREKYKEGMNIVGFAPYNVISYTTNEQEILERYDGYPWANKYTFKRIVIKSFPDASSLRLALEKGEIDVAVHGMTKFDLADLAKKSGVKVGYQEGSMRLLKMDQHYDYFKNMKVRQAVAEVINQEELVKAAVPMCKPTYSFPQRRMPYLNDEAWLSRYGKHDLEKAKKLMAEAGYPNGFKTDLWICEQYQSIETEMNLATVAKEQLAKIGIDVTIKSTTNAIFTQKRRNTGEMPMSLMGWYEDYPDVDSYVDYLFGSPWGKDAGITAETYPEIAALVKKGRDIYDPTKETPFNPERKKIYDQIHDMSAEKALWVPLYTELRGQAWRDWVVGYKQPWQWQLFVALPMYEFDYQVYKKAPAGMF